jgi:glycosyltransferase involved in cell wall biosynthesis
MTRILTAQWVDRGNNNAQVLNARAMLARFSDPGCRWVAMHYDAPDPRLVGRTNVTLARLWRRHLWYAHKALLYQSPVDAVFYPGPYWFDELGLALRRLSGRKVPVIATLEGLVGDEERERMLSAWAGHPVYCQQVSPAQLRRIDRILARAERVIAISPFLAEMGRRLYGDKFTVLPLGIEPVPAWRPPARANSRPRVIGAGRLYPNKRPDLFLELARRFPGADFVWYGEGEMREHLLAQQRLENLSNVSYPGAVAHPDLLQTMAAADAFVLPSRSEGVPKVTQEAAASGLPVILFGYYQAPSVIDGENGYVVWDDQELMERMETLLHDPGARESLGARGALMAQAWDWDRVAPRWERAVSEVVNS